MFLRYLAIPLGFCVGFVPTRDVPCRFFHSSNKQLNIPNVFQRDSPFLLFVCRKFSEDEQKNNLSTHFDQRRAEGTLNRRQVLVVAGALATTPVTTTSTEASTTPTVQPHKQQSFENGANDKDVFDYSNTKPNRLKSLTIDKSESNHKKLLRSSKMLRVQTKSSMSKGSATQNQSGPSVKKVSPEGLLQDLQSKRAIFLGEHHPDGRDHLLQAALIRSLYDSIHSNDFSALSNNSAASGATLVVGLEAIQRKFQPILDQYCAGAIDEVELRRATEWETRWYWSFEAYKPIFQTCRELGISLLALDISTEDRLLVEQGGLEAIDDQQSFLEYVPDKERFLAFGKTLAYESFVNYTLKPPYRLQQRTDKQRNRPTAISFSNFVTRQMLRDEGMASAAFGWLSKNLNGILVGCVGINHATFGCGVQGRLEQKLSLLGETKSNKNSQRMVASVLINPDPLNTGTELKICQREGRPPTEDDDGDTPASQIFVPNTINQICIENRVEVQNYALQLEYLSSSNTIQERMAATEEATLTFQARKGETVLGLSDYLIFSPKETSQRRG